MLKTAQAGYSPAISYNQKITALYCRLSKEEQQRFESLSIENQRRILEKFAADNGFMNTKVFVDDGETGVFFDRPGLNEMLAEIRAGKVSTVIIKDQSRIGREVIEIGLLKRTFEEFNVRFMSAEDGLDTAKGFDIMSLLRDVFNEWFVADTSKKIRAVFKSKGESGKPLANYPPFGYKKDPTDKNKWVVDEEAAEIVRYIFRLCMEGHGLEAISKKMAEKSILTPKAYAAEKGNVKYTNLPEDPYNWLHCTIGGILDRREYTGDTVNFKTYSKSYKNRKRYYNLPENIMIFEGTHEPIIDRVTFEAVQRIRSGKRRLNRSGEPSKFSGILFCADCGAKLYAYRVNTLIPEKEYFVCSTYRKKKSCTSHSMRSKVAEQLILEDIRRVVNFAKKHEKKFIKLVSEKSEKESAKELKGAEKELSGAVKRITELDKIITRLYEDNVNGKINDERFFSMMAGYEEEQKGLKERVQILEKTVSEAKARTSDIEHFLKLVHKTTDIPELTSEVLREFVEKIIIYEKKENQRMKIIYNCIGEAQLPKE